MEPSLATKIRAVLQAKGPAYHPEAAHRNPDGSPRYTNRLILETSPYLMQHAHNPVDWRPWGDEAFEEAKRLGRPVLLSVGYSTCHWCHMMEQESFEDEEIARFLNEHFITIKVDREERPDVDSLYLSAVQALTGGGGWPLNVWLTSAREPFYGGTYFPARDGDRGASTGFLTLLRKIDASYRRPGTSLGQSARKLTLALHSALSSPSAGDLPGPATLRKAMESYQRAFDSEEGGLRGASKFPATLPVRFLLRFHRRSGDAQSLRMATLTLEKMAAGGIHDQVGGGFHRYSTDARWRVPHFEKMLYDNALLSLAYLEGYQVTGRQDFARVARETLRYLQRDMMSPEGAFYAATDADSNDSQGRPAEGWFFTWTPGDLRTVLGETRARLALACFGVTTGGNFLGGRSILYREKPPEEAARELGLSPAQARASLDACRDDLYRERLRRSAPHRDEKIVTAWNGLAVSAFARASLALGDPTYARQANRTADFLLKRALLGDRLRRSVVAGVARQDGFLSDYAFLEAGLLDLYEATGNPERLSQALSLDSLLEKRFEDTQGGGFFLTAEDGEKLLVREKPSEDGAEPSGNSVAVMNLLRLHELTTQQRFRERAERGLKSFGAILAENPTALSEMLLAVDFHDDAPREIVLVAPHRKEEVVPFLERLRRVYLPNKVLVVSTEGKELSAQADQIPLLSGKQALQGKTTAYVCENRVCRLPTTSPAEFERQIRPVRPLGDNGAHPEGSGRQGKP